MLRGWFTSPKPRSPQAPHPRGFAPEDGKPGAIRASFSLSPRWVERSEEPQSAAIPQTPLERPVERPPQRGVERPVESGVERGVERLPQCGCSVHWSVGWSVG